MDGDDKILCDWLLERMDQGHFPSLLEIGRKAHELHLRPALRSKAGASYMMLRSGLKERWRVGARERIALENRKVNNFNYFSSNKTKSPSPETGVEIETSRVRCLI